MKAEKNDHKKELSIRLTPDGFSFYIDAVPQTEAYFQSYAVIDPNQYTEILEKAIYEEKLPDEIYRNVSIVISEVPFTFIPRQISLPEEDYSFFLLPDKNKTEKGILLTNEFKQMEMRLLFYMEENLYYLLSRIFPEACFEHRIIEASKSFLQLVTKENKSLFVLCEKKTVSLLLYEDTKLYANSFSSHHPEDTVYYILNLFNQFQMDQLLHKIYMVGEEQKTKSLKDILSRYVKHIKPFQEESEMIN